MPKLAILHPGIYGDPKNDALTTSFLADVTVVRYTDRMTKEELIAAVTDPSGLTHVAFVYHYPGYSALPFFPDILPPQDEETEIVVSDMTQPQPKYRYFSDKVIDILASLRSATSERLTVDILTCDLNDADYKREVQQIEADLGINIRYSVDKTGNPAEGGNWILESEDPAVSVLPIYFTDGVLAWTDVLTGDITATVKLNTTYVAFIVWNEGTNTFTVQQNFNWAASLPTGPGLNNTSFITMGPNETFDGSGYRINLTNATGTNITVWPGFIVVDNISVTSLTDAPLIKNIDISGGIFQSGAGGIVRQSQKFFKVDKCRRVAGAIAGNCGGIAGANAGANNGSCLITNCDNSGNMSTSGGGIAGLGAGANGGSCKIVGCNNSGNLGSACGGIVGVNAGTGTNGSCQITNCTNSKSIISNGGGIAGQNAGSNGGSCKIVGCSNTGPIIGLGAGGIVGLNAGSGSNGLCEITDCSNNGITISSPDGGGIVGSNAGSSAGKCVVTRCSNIGNITGGNSIAGGIVGANAGKDGSCQITNCYNTGTINGSAAGGIVGADGGACNVGNGSCEITNCYNTGDIYGTSTGGIAGGISTALKAICVIRKCYNTGDIVGTTTPGSGPGGIAGASVTGPAASPYRIEDCFNTGDIIGPDAGGIVGGNSGQGQGPTIEEPLKCIIKNCYSTGDISGNNAGGIAGSSAGTNLFGESEIINCYSLGTIIGVAAGGIAGGTAGNNGGSCVVTNCYSMGDIIGDEAGGIIGSSVVFQEGGSCKVTNCYSAGSILGIYAGGIAGNPNDTIDDNASCVIRDCVSNGRQIYVPFPPEITLINPSTILNDINGAIYTNWLPSVWLIGNPVTVTVDSQSVDYRLPILNGFRFTPWNSDTYNAASDEVQFGISQLQNRFALRVNPFVSTGNVLVYTQKAIDALVANGSGTSFTESARASWAPLGAQAGSLLRDLRRSAVVKVSPTNPLHAYRFQRIQLIAGPDTEGVGGSATDKDAWQTGWICTWSADGVAPVFY
jgi:hypothetical protein